MEITAEITGIEYKVLLNKELKTFDLKDFDINTLPSCCLISDGKKSFAISKWVSPKRTRTYPYERVYNTLTISKKITVIPVVKDEGCGGDRDFIQWDTVSLMSLLDVYVIFAFYNKAEKNRKKKNKITRQQFNNQYILSKIKEISSYHSSALHWNLKEIDSGLSAVISKATIFYSSIEQKLKVKPHSPQGLDAFKKQFAEDVKFFMESSRKKAREAQSREYQTIQPKEVLQTFSKAKITIVNYLGGKYFLTLDEAEVRKDKIYLIESKHSKSLMPHRSDLKDGLLKMILFSNLKNVTLDSTPLVSYSVLKLTSEETIGKISSNESFQEKESFFKKNKFMPAQINFLETLFKEAKTNNFTVILQNG